MRKIFEIASEEKKLLKLTPQRYLDRLE